MIGTHGPDPVSYTHLKLGHLVNTGFSYKAAHRRYPWVMGRSPACFFLSRILNLHRTELVHLKGPVVEADPLLTVENGARRGQLYEDVYKRQGLRHLPHAF